MFYQTFLSPQAKRCTIVTYNHGIYELPHQLPNDLTLRKLGNIREVPKPHRIIAQRPDPLTNFVNASKKTLENRKLNLSHRALLHMKLKLTLKCFMTGCSTKFLMREPFETGF